MNVGKVIAALSQERGLCTGTLIQTEGNTGTLHVGCLVGALLVGAGEPPINLVDKSMPDLRQRALLKREYDLSVGDINGMINLNDALSSGYERDPETGSYTWGPDTTNEERLTLVIGTLAGMLD